jgi:hemoglobin-like flavoprotein
MPKQIFVSYSHEDERWRKVFQTGMGGGFFEKAAFELFFDTKIEKGKEWKREIDAAIAKSRIALLLVGRGFLRSGFIANKELPKIFSRWKAGGVTIFWVPIHTIPAPVLKLTRLHDIEAAWAPSKPLSGLSEDQLEDALMHIAGMLTEKIELLDSPKEELGDELKSKVVEVMHDTDTVLGETFAAGDYSLFYKARRGDDDFVVKALIPSAGRPWLSRDFVSRAKAVCKVTNSTAIGIRGIFPDPRVPCVTMDFVRLPTLATHLKKEGKLDPPLVADVLAQLVRLAGHLHGLDGQPIIGPVRPSHVHYDSAKPKAFISLLPIVNETLATCLDNPTWLQDPETLSYLSPERYYGEKIDWRTDQYYLGLLALELLQGKPPVEIRSFADFQQTTEFFNSPRASFAKAFKLGQPGFSFVLAKMLERYPRNRWESIPELVSALQAITQGKIPEGVKRYADDQYSLTLRKNPNFFRSFYQILFEQSDEIRALFGRRAGIDEQSQKLNKAMASILNFNQQMRTSILEREVDHHRGMRIKAKHFTLFRDAFLQALHKAKIVDGYSQDAWRAILDPALNYMKDEVGKARR